MQNLQILHESTNPQFIQNKKPKIRNTIHNSQLTFHPKPHASNQRINKRRHISGIEKALAEIKDYLKSILM